jgi:CheY-like chemotaxis protein
METAVQPFVLFVEDDPLLADLVARKFGIEKIEMEYARTGEEALVVLDKERKPDLILLDIRLPGIDGFEVLEKIKSDESTKHIPVVIFSNFGEASDIERAKKLGADKFIVKVSLTLEQVADVVRTLAAK